MARVTVIRTDVPFMYLNDLENRSQRNPPYEGVGQSRYVGSVVLGNGNGRFETIQAFLLSVSATESVATLLAGTVGSSDVSTGTIQSTIASVVLTAGELIELQDLLSFRFVETGPFLLSFDSGVISGLLAATFTNVDVAGIAIEVFADDGSTTFTL